MIDKLFLYNVSMQKIINSSSEQLSITNDFIIKSKTQSININKNCL